MIILFLYQGIWTAMCQSAPVAATAAGPPANKLPKPEILTNGFIDVMNGGQMNASARLFRLYIGEPGVFQLPVSLYTGVSANTLNPSAQRTVEAIPLTLMNPLAGVLNISVDGLHYLGKPPRKKLTKAAFQYQAGEKVLNSIPQPTQRSVTWFSSFANAGFLFQTGAWERQDENNMGVFWVLARYMLTRPGPDLRTILPDEPPHKKIMPGYSLGCGIEINNVLSVKAFFYKYSHIREGVFATGIWHFSFNYSMR